MLSDLPNYGYAEHVAIGNLIAAARKHSYTCTDAHCRICDALSILERRR